MFRSVSWLQYIETILILFSIYYPVVILLYFRKDVLKYFTHGIIFSKPVDQANEISRQDIQPAVYELMDDLNRAFKNATDKKLIKEELLMMLQKLMKQYPQLKEHELKNEITQHIKSHCSDRCNMMLSDEEIKMLW